MPSAKCAVNDCRNYLLHTTGISYHLLPAREDIKRRWEEALGRPLPPYARICSAHFKKADYTPSPACRKRIRRRLKSTAVPSVKCGKWTKIAHEIFRVPSVDITAIIDGLGANVEVGKPSCASYLAPCTCASRQRAGTSEVVTQTQDDLKDMIANVSMLNKPYDEHSYASRWCSPTYAHARPSLLMAGGLATPADTEMLGPTKAAAVSDNSQPWCVHGTTGFCEPRDARPMVDYRLCDWSSTLS
ncbi:hypothetical protein HPB50_013855 [Hyalomma asiaticum]|uniref:Uncharacterized protein n=1 Tax=Hyalomma asiaticum TaxID=266040 RepID=A0ACB7RP98_HYAAI|nr:hypothetical protein HPB50_013855 [Hyalomma asiaticum]